MKIDHLSQTAALLVALLPSQFLREVDAREPKDVLTLDVGRRVNGVSFEVGPRGIKVRVLVTHENNAAGTYRVERVVLCKGLRGPRVERVLHEGVEAEHLASSFEQVARYNP